MSDFHCPECGMLCIDTELGYISGCRHYPPDLPFNRLNLKERRRVRLAEQEYNQPKEERGSLA